MPIPLDVEKQHFEFSAPWTVAIKYDDTVFFRKEAIKLQGQIDGVSHSTRAVDVIGLHKNSGLLLLEAKDFRGHRIENKDRIKNEVSVEVAVKVRDTVAALIGLARKPVAEFPAEELAAALSPGKKISVVLWLEDDTFCDVERTKQKLGVLTGVLKSKLSWLNVRSLVLSSAVDNRISDMRVTNLPSAGRPNP